MNKRIEDIDILKGIAILLMILDHCFGWGQGIFLHSVIQSFHMPLFFIVGEVALGSVPIKAECMRLKGPQD